MIAIYKRDLKGFFTGMMGYVLLAFFLAVGGLYFTVMNLMSGYPDLSYTLYNNLFVLLLLVPLLTMRSFAEERRARTDQLLLTSPVPLWRIVLGKYLAVLSVFGMAVLVFALYPLIMSRGGAVSYRQSYAALLAFFLLGAACIAIGVFLSSLNENQIVAALLGAAAGQPDAQHPDAVHCGQRAGHGGVSGAGRAGGCLCGLAQPQLGAGAWRIYRVLRGHSGVVLAAQCGADQRVFLAAGGAVPVQPL